MSKDPSALIFLFENSVKYEWRHHLPDKADPLLSILRDSCGKRDLQFFDGHTLYRSQQGVAQTMLGIFKTPHPVERMKPQRGNSSEGRLNPKGITYLYLSEDAFTALSESRPWKGGDLTLARVEITRDIMLIDCSQDERVDYQPGISEWNDSELEEHIWGYVNGAFSRPVNVSNPGTEYIPTQVIAEMFRALTYDGIRYKSALGKGYNIALFDPSLVEIKERLVYMCDDIVFYFSKDPRF